MIFFTKTCARDWKRCCYQMLAIRRLFPLTKHVVMIESGELEKALLEVERHGDDALERAMHVALFQRGDLTQVYSVEMYVPEAMAIEDPDLRQQYVKLRAPLVFGEDMIQLDSDMCPKPVQTRWADELYHGSWMPEGRGRIQRWDFYTQPIRYRGAMEKWAETYAWFNGGLASTHSDDLYMGSQYGWYINRQLARDFFQVLGDGGESCLREPRFVVDRILEARSAGMKFSEYQLLGTYARGRGYYRFNELHDLPSAQPISKIGEWSWLLHFSSKEPLEPEQEAQLREAAGLV